MRIHLTQLTTALLTAMMLTIPLAATASHDQTDTEAILLELESNRKLLVAENMNLAAERQNAFWKVYDDYRSEIIQHEKQGLSLLREFREHFDDLTNERAAKVITDYFALEQKKLTVRSSYRGKIRSGYLTETNTPFLSD